MEGRLSGVCSHREENAKREGIPDGGSDRGGEESGGKRGAVTAMLHAAVGHELRW